MKAFLKIFAITFVSFVLAMGAGLWGFSKFHESSSVQTELGEENNSNVDIIDTVEAQEPVVEKSELEKLIEESKRVNVLLLGMEGPRTDTIVLASFDPVAKKVDLISIPRDTYYARKGYNTADKKKLNAVYGDTGAEGTMAAVSELLAGIPVHHYVKVTYTGVERIVDSLGGVKINVPFDMKYDDPYDTPPLHINIPKGTQVLKGKDAVHFLRFRKDYPDGDLGRIRAQQKFMKAAMGKVFSFRLPVVANTVFKYVKTDMALSEILVLAGDAVGMNLESIQTHGLPGKATEKGVSYFLHDGDAAKQLVSEIYKNEMKE
ncbi:LCP family protein required for cell wall assembly [Anaerosolibacter carboniphilus]|uniref:LCP family protein required for cell wall assembly n=1 Tax=Anaerosolibacter carboniphilus TaxID=1417629 RepID=A0A841KYA6_9FIRM|nr:LCP family protein [Anaerosolibacter carboniphilus]MBB6218451.1 LCP family protein required for cell wall assembly [Anaerosolibacter carboniphilus]